ncbi:unnamed protein product [Mycena citricolor]|uniref:MnmG N-terminal domain-containing protein n=1 Tax=Mycena citricolor TaxID=2018698 RepID=A0AAD2HBX3_9AGAR|nr:unnamed protein product [Mycena citricolor]
MKTGTPARLDARSIDFSRLEEQQGDETPVNFHILLIQSVLKQIPCYLVYTSKEVHDILRSGFADSPLFNGTIKGIGPRYCPSIEDKLRTFAGKDSHQLFLEPEGADTHEYYLNGFSSSLPWDIQVAALQKSRIRKCTTLPARLCDRIRLFSADPALPFAGDETDRRIVFCRSGDRNDRIRRSRCTGTDGRNQRRTETAGRRTARTAARRIVHRGIDRRPGHQGVDEPYRMFTSRAEYRILLRQDNADIRLTPISYKIGLADEKGIEKRCKKNRP